MEIGEKEVRESYFDSAEERRYTKIKMKMEIEPEELWEDIAKWGEVVVVGKGISHIQIFKNHEIQTFIYAPFP